MPVLNEQLIEAVVLQIEKDIQNCDYTSIEELLRFVPEQYLSAYIEE